MEEQESLNEFIKKRMKEYRTDKSRRCYVCGEVVPIIDIIDHKAKVQSITGRVFCDDTCWHQYLNNEGF